MIGRLAAFAAACLLWRWDQRRREREQLATTPRAKPEAVTTWEGEGGALPTTGAQLGPPPARP